MGKLKLRVKDLKEVPEGLREFYRELPDDGGWQIDHEQDPDGFGVDNLAAIRGKLQEALTDKQRQVDKLQSYKKSDGSLYTSEEIAEAFRLLSEKDETITTLKDKTKTDEQKLAEMVTSAKRPLEEQLNMTKEKAERYRRSVMDAMRDRFVNEALDELKPQDRWRSMIAREIAAHMDVRETDNGDWTHVVLDRKTGQPRMSSLQGRDGPMDVREFVNGDFKKQFADLLQGDNMVGAGINEPAGRKGGQRGYRSGKNIQITPEQANDFAFYQDMAAKAAEQGGIVEIMQD